MAEGDERGDVNMNTASLASRLGISVDKLDFSYISSCKDAKEIEKILRVLRSGEEGTFCELEKKAEECLNVINPKSRLLRKEQPLLKPSDLGAKESAFLKEDLTAFFDDVNRKDQLLKQKSASSDQQPSAKDMPPVRSSHAIASVSPSVKHSAKIEQKAEFSKKSAKPKEYREWDKIIATIDKDEEPTVPVPTSQKGQPPVAKTSEPPGLKDSLDTNGMTDMEKEKRSLHEKEKGNEALKSGSYAEALIYYNRSLRIYPSTAVFNNRALAHVKMEKWEEAVEDCNYVLSRDANDIKALLRRATAYKGQHKYPEGKRDVELVLSMEPHNLRAKELLDDIGKHIGEESLRKKASVPKRIVIEETDGEESDSEGSSSASGTKAEMEIHAKQHSEDVQQHTQLSQQPELSAGTDSYQYPVVGPQTVGPTTLAGSGSLSHPQPRVIKVGPLPPVVATLSVKGNELYKAGQYGDAKTCYDQALQELRSSSTADDHTAVHQIGYHLATLYSNRAACCSKVGDARGCVEDCTTALELTPHAAKPLYRRALAYEQLEKYASAYADYRHYLARIAADGGTGEDAAMQAASRCQSYLQQHYGPKWREHVPKVPPVVDLTVYEFSNASDSYPASMNVTSSVTAVTASSNPSKADIYAANGRNDTGLSHPTISTAASEGCARDSKLGKYEAIKGEGNAFFKKGDYRSAIKCYTDCIELSPELAVGYANRAECYLRTGLVEKAVDDARHALRFDPNSTKALYRLARAYKQLGQYEESYKQLTKILILDKDNKDAQKELELLKPLIVKSASSQRVSHFGTRNENHPTCTTTSRRISIEETDTDESDTETTGSTSEDSSCKTYDAEGKGENSTAQESADDVSTGADKRHVMADAAAASPNVEQLSDSTLLQRSVMASREKCNRLREAGQFLEALALYNETVDLLKGHELEVPELAATVYTDRAACRLQTDDATGCLDDCKAALEWNPCELDILQLRARAYEHLSRPTSTGEGTDSSGSAAPQQGAAMCLNVHTQQENKEENQATGCPLINVPTLPEMSYEQLKDKGRQHVVESEYQKAADIYSECIARFGDDVVMYTNRALCRIRLGQADGAADDCHAALRREPANVKALYRLAQAEKLRKNYRESLCALNKLLQHGKDNKEVQQELATVKELYRMYLKQLQSQSKKDDTASPCIMSQRSNAPKAKGNAAMPDECGAIDASRLLPNKKPNGNSRAPAAVSSEGSQPMSHAVPPVDTSSSDTPPASSLSVESQLTKNPSMISPAVFMVAWNKTRKVKTTRIYADLLRRIKPSDIPKAFANQIDGDMLSKIICSLRDHFVSSEDDLAKAYEILVSVASVSRFRMAKAFLSRSDQDALSSLFALFSRSGMHAESLLQLEEAYRFT